MLLQGKRVLVTGVLDPRSIAFSIARVAMEEGADVVLTSFGRAMRLTQTTARRLPTTPDVLELDVTDADHVAALARALDERWGALDGLVHAVAYAPPVVPGRRVPDRALGGRRDHAARVDVLAGVPRRGARAAAARR